MPRIIDLLDAAVGHTPDVLDRKVDYLAQRAPPERVVGEDGTYTPGWFTAAPEVLNFEDSSAFEMAFQRWFHFTLDCPEHFIIFNVADFTRATNTAILVANKQTGTFDHSSLTRLLVGGVEVSEDQRHFTDRDSQSVIAVSPDDRQFRFSVHAENLHLTGVAEHTLGPPMIQCTGFHRGRGSLQWYGCVRLRFGVLTIGDTVIELPPCYGTYDRTMGHQRGLQGWNWIAMVGEAVRESDGHRAPIGLQIARDIPGRARPVVESKKYIVWLDGRVLKLPDARFEYSADDQRTSGPWRIFTPESTGDGVDLHFEPRFHRREQRSAWLVEADFNQYYGPVDGRLRLGDERWSFEQVFAVTEDSLLQL